MNPSKGYESKSEKVKDIFTNIAGDYDRVNRVISFGQIGRWRKRLLGKVDKFDTERVLDLGCGSGQLTRLIADNVKAEEIVGVDLTPEMIEKARSKLPETYGQKVRFLISKGESLDLPTDYFDLATSAFTLRNVEDISQVLSEMRRVVKPGGKVINLELAKPQFPVFRHLYYFYFNDILPILGGFIHGSTAPYRYLTESLKNFPDQENLKEIFQGAGLKDVYYNELFGGIAAIHSGTKRES